VNKAKHFCKMMLLAMCMATLSLSVFAAVPSKNINSSKEKSLGHFGAWNAYAYQEGGQTVCYMVTTKTTKATVLKSRATPYLMITHRPVEASTDVISYGAGTLIDSKRSIKLNVGKEHFSLFSVRDTAWSRDSLTDHKIAAAIRNVSLAQVSGYSFRKKDPALVDRFDLTGAQDAYQAIGKACGLITETPKKPALSKKPVAKSIKKTQ
jgi:hypothetical protein